MFISIQAVVCSITIFSFLTQDGKRTLEDEIRLQLRDFEFEPNTIINMGPNAIPFIKKILSDSSVEDIHIARLLCVIKGMRGDRSEYLSFAKARLLSQEPAVKRAALALLADIGDSSCLQSIVTLLSDTDITVAYQASLTLGSVGDKDTIAAIDIWISVSNLPDKAEYKALHINLKKTKDKIAERLKQKQNK